MQKQHAKINEVMATMAHLCKEQQNLLHAGANFTVPLTSAYVAAVPARHPVAPAVFWHVWHHILALQWQAVYGCKHNTLAFAVLTCSVAMWGPGKWEEDG